MTLPPKKRKKKNKSKLSWMNKKKKLSWMKKRKKKPKTLMLKMKLLAL